jgi:hypothetical protein
MDTRKTEWKRRTKEFAGRVVRDDCAISLPEIPALGREADGLIAIFVTMAKNTKQNRKET